MGGGGGKNRVSRSTRAGLAFDVGRVSKTLNRGNYADAIERNVPVFVAGVLQYLAMEVLQLAGNAARDDHKTRILPRHIRLATGNDKELTLLFRAHTISDDENPLADDALALSNDDADTFAHNADALSNDSDNNADDIAGGGILSNLHNSLLPEKTDGGKIGSTQADAMRSGALDHFSLDVFDPFDAPSTGLGKDITAGGKIQFDWKETLDAHIFKADLPGLMEEEVKIEVEDGGILQISGVRIKEEEGDKFHLVERAQGVFVRRFRLPENALLDEGNASMENGVLTVTVPKQMK